MLPVIQPIPLLAPADYQSGAQDFDSINMGKLHKVDILIMLGAITGNDPVIKLYSGATAASADVFGARASIAAGASGLTFADSGDYNLRTIWIEFMSDQMTDGHEW